MCQCNTTGHAVVSWIQAITQALSKAKKLLGLELVTFCDCTATIGANGVCVTAIHEVFAHHLKFARAI